MIVARYLVAAACCWAAVTTAGMALGSELVRRGNRRVGRTTPLPLLFLAGYGGPLALLALAAAAAVWP